MLFNSLLITQIYVCRSKELIGQERVLRRHFRFITPPLEVPKWLKRNFDRLKFEHGIEIS